MEQETVEIDGIMRVIIYDNVKIGDIIYDKNTKRPYIADISDADEAKWIVQSLT